jgi:NitT/TauT family transport system substrate-binding protein
VYLLAFVLAIAALAAAACGGGDEESAANPPAPAGEPAPAEGSSAPAEGGLSMTDISVSMSKDPQLATQTLVAQKQGFFDEVGLNVELRTWADGSQIPAAMAAGQVGMAQSIESDALSIIAQGAPVKMVAGISNMSSTIGLVVPNSVSIPTPKDIEGKTIGGTLAAYLYRWLDGFCQQGQKCDPDAVNLVNIDPPDHATVITTGDVDGLISFEPYLDLSALNDARIVATGTGYDMDDFKEDASIWTGQITLYVRDEMIQDHPDVLVAYLEAMQKANEWINEDKDRAAALLAPEFGLDEAVTRSVMERNIYGLAIDDQFLADVKDVGEFMVSDNEIPENPPLTESVDTSILKQVDPALVTAEP